MSEQHITGRGGFALAPAGRQLLVGMLSRIRFQLGGGIVVAVLVPILIRWPAMSGVVASISLQNSIWATLGAVIFGYVVIRRLGIFPGVQSISLIMPVLGLTYLAVITFFFFLRIDYSRFHMLVSFVLAMGWFFLVFMAEMRVRRPSMAMLPFGDSGALRTIDSIDWIPLVQPDSLPDRSSAVVADLRADMPPAWEGFLARCVLKGIPVYHSKQVAEFLTGRVQIEHLSENSFGSLLPSSVYVRVKRGLDLLGVLLLLPLLLPVCLIVAILVRIDSPGPILFRQTRMGFRGHRFTIFKFRTMHVGHEGRRFTGGNDSRITRIGRALRKYRLDELPQAYNILRGEMSWIGPRPEAMELSDWYEAEIPFYSYRHIVRPGITGWAQVRQGYAAQVAEATEKLHYDFYYIKYFSPWLDLLITALTLKTILSGFGAR